MPNVRKKAKDTMNTVNDKMQEHKDRAGQKAGDMKSDIKAKKHESDDGLIDSTDSY